MSRWVATWARTPSTPTLDAATPSGAARAPVFADRTLRQIARVSIGGDALRVRVSNAYGDAALVLGGAHVALRASGARIAAGTDRALTFGGSPSAYIDPGATAQSDPVALEVPALAELAVSLYLPGETAGTTVHGSGTQTNYVLEGDATGVEDPAVVATTLAVHFLTNVEVHAPDGSRLVVCLGDSLTAGAWSTADAHRGWPERLAARLAEARAGKPPIGVVNQGYSGNRLLRDRCAESALARFDRDVLAQAGVTDVIVFEGINDLAGFPGDAAGAADVIAGLRELARRARAAGLRVHAGTLTPFAGAAVHTPDTERQRAAVNAFIRSGGEFDAVLDFDAAVRDGDRPARLQARYDAGDHIHLNDAGYAALASAIELRLFG